MRSSRDGEAVWRACRSVERVPYKKEFGRGMRDGQRSIATNYRNVAVDVYGVSRARATALAMTDWACREMERINQLQRMFNGDKLG